MKIEIKNRYTGEIMHAVEDDTLVGAVQELIKRNADLGNADLGNADLRNANLGNADLGNANLGNANLRNANLGYANLGNAINSELAAAMAVIAPEGEIIGWKLCLAGVLVKVKIPAEAKRSNATGRKCRAEYVDVLEVFGAEVGISKHDNKTEYRVGQRVTCHEWNANRWEECSGGIHFFITRAEAEAYT